MAAWCAQLSARQRLFSLLIIVVCIVAHTEAHRSLLQPSAGKSRGNAVKSNAPDAKFDNVDSVTGEPAPPFGKRCGFKKNGDVKQFLTQLGPDLTEQLLSTANYLNTGSVEAALAALEQMLSNSDDVVSCVAVTPAAALVPAKLLCCHLNGACMQPVYVAQSTV
jgi:hypothetical protein